jgi:hypothetical protein
MITILTIIIIKKIEIYKIQYYLLMKLILFFASVIFIVI